jgi:branched-chain amino acid transport system permease protein
VIALRWVRDRGLHRGAQGGVLGGIVAMAGLVGLLGAAYLHLAGGLAYDLVVNFAINAVLVVGLQTLVGNTGIMSFGHMAFVSVGAYTAGVAVLPVALKASFLPHLPAVLRDHSWPAVAALLAAGLAAAALALLTGPALMRLTGIAAGITTFGVLVIMNGLVRNARDFTRGNQTFFGVPRAATLPLVFGTLVGAVAIAALVKWSAVGLRARAVKEDSLAAETAGISLLGARLWPFVASAFISGAGGALLAYQLTAFSPNSFYLVQTIPVVVMVILGGIDSIAGALVGTVLLTAWLEVVRNVEAGSLGPLRFPAVNGVAELSVGVGLVLLLLWRPRGALGAREPQLSLRRRGARRGAVGGATPPTGRQGK